jgi:hypothetical protein
MPSKPLYVLFYAILKIKLFEEEKNMMEKGLKKPVKLKADLAAFCGVGTLPRLEITKKLWDHIKAKKLQAKTANGKPEGSGKFIVADEKLIKHRHDAARFRGQCQYRINRNLAYSDCGPSLAANHSRGSIAKVCR